MIVKTVVSPAALVKLGLLPQNYKRKAKGNWQGPCPLCGGKTRFSVYIHPNTGLILYRCCKCDFNGEVN